MYVNSFEERVHRIEWRPTAVPSRALIDNMLGARLPRRPRSAVLSLAAAITGLLIGVGLKGMTLEGSPWGPGTGFAGLIGGGLSLAGLALSVTAAIAAAWQGRKTPRLMQFASMNLLMIVVLLLS
ncbi:hypothetical protein AB9K35_20575 [Leisingera sp. XS_AS12]|uniref:hypothetical protein n=1 Tax=Leisingera sp. XS_AS12 TaxID=3241294 RepID=UPI003513727E